MIGMILMCKLISAVILGFALIVWIIASKESGIVKILGQILAVIIALLVVCAFSYGVIKGCRHGMCPMCKPGNSCMMHSGDKAKMMKMHDKMMMKMEEKGMKCKVKETK